MSSVHLFSVGGILGVPTLKSFACALGARQAATALTSSLEVRGETLFSAEKTKAGRGRYMFKPGRHWGWLWGQEDGLGI